MCRDGMSELNEWFKWEIILNNETERSRETRARENAIFLLIVSLCIYVFQWVRDDVSHCKACVYRVRMSVPDEWFKWEIILNNETLRSRETRARENAFFLVFSLWVRDLNEFLHIYVKNDDDGYEWVRCVSERNSLSGLNESLGSKEEK